MPKSWSEGLIKKAKKIIKENLIAKSDENTYQVKSLSKPDEIYIIENHECNCLGFKMNHYCSHQLAVKILEGVVIIA